MGTRNVTADSFAETLDLLIVALCRGYEARERAIHDGSCKRRTLMEYAYINRRLADATREIVGDDYLIYIHEIGERIGYAYSGVDDTCETEYKVKKKLAKINIARKLHLLD